MNLPTRSSLEMTRRQVEIMHLVADGETDAEIAQTLGIRPSTARAHVANVRDRILINHPDMKGGRPRPVILRYFRFVESIAFKERQEIP